MWWRPDFETLLFPYLSNNVKGSKVVIWIQTTFIKLRLLSDTSFTCNSLTTWCRSALNFSWSSCRRVESSLCQRTSSWSQFLYANFMKTIRYPNQGTFWKFNLWHLQILLSLKVERKEKKVQFCFENSWNKSLFEMWRIIQLLVNFSIFDTYTFS